MNSIAKREPMEAIRLREEAKREKNWKRWGPYLSDRQWATVREDYSPDGSCWDYLPHDHARSRAYRWGEDGLLGITDREARLCFGLALWNGKDSILKERLYGLTGSQGNHGEDVKECYYYLESSPTHSYMKALYKYPQSEFPYSRLNEVNASRSKWEPEFELDDTGVFDNNEFWDVFAEYVKNMPNDILIKITVINRSSKKATLHVLPTLWYRNTWSWGCTHEGCSMRPRLVQKAPYKVEGNQETLGKTYWEVDRGPNGILPKLLFTENDTNTMRLWNLPNETPYVKDAFHRYVIQGEQNAINPKDRGTKVAAHYVVQVDPGQAVTLRSRLYSSGEGPIQAFGYEFEKIFSQRKQECDEYFQSIFAKLPPEQKLVARQAMAGLLWSKQFYHYSVRHWLDGDPMHPAPPAERKKGRNHDWNHLYNRDVVSMPDKWEYPWYASWDLAFHMLPFGLFDINFAKDQLILFLREWYMHPNGQIPAYEFAFDDVNPPVHAWAVRKIYKMSGSPGKRDVYFLGRCFQKLILNFTWWVNRKDPKGKNIFSGGFLGLDNIGIFDRSKPLPCEMEMEQADGTAWMAFFCIIMLDIALELAVHDPVYEDMASKFFEHFIFIVDAINTVGQGGGLWHEEDGFYYDYIRTKDGQSIPLRIRSLVGIVPIFSCLVLSKERLQKLKAFSKRTEWFVKNRDDLAEKISYMTVSMENQYLLAVPNKEQLTRILKYLLDENEFLSPYGIRSLSKIHQTHPFELTLPGHHETFRVDYVPGESVTNLFGGNSNWRGPVWFCMNFIIIEVLRRYHFYYGSTLQVECPTNSGNLMTLDKVSQELSNRLIKLFLSDGKGFRPCHGTDEKYAKDPAWKDLILFYEYFHGDTGRGCGASHQTGWTALVLNCMTMLNQAKEN